jgi:hypothetical protein
MYHECMQVTIGRQARQGRCNTRHSPTMSNVGRVGISRRASEPEPSPSPGRDSLGSGGRLGSGSLAGALLEARTAARAAAAAAGSTGSSAPGAGFSIVRVTVLEDVEGSLLLLLLEPDSISARQFERVAATCAGRQ